VADILHVLGYKISLTPHKILGETIETSARQEKVNVAEEAQCLNLNI
jgi:hypothetical protein